MDKQNGMTAAEAAKAFKKMGEAIDKYYKDHPEEYEKLLRKSESKIKRFFDFITKDIKKALGIMGPQTFIKDFTDERYDLKIKDGCEQLERELEELEARRGVEMKRIMPKEPRTKEQLERSLEHVKNNIELQNKEHEKWVNKFKNTVEQLEKELKDLESENILKNCLNCEHLKRGMGTEGQKTKTSYWDCEKNSDVSFKLEYLNKWGKWTANYDEGPENFTCDLWKKEKQRKMNDFNFRRITK